MDELINKLATARNAIQHLEYFVPTERNCNQILVNVRLIHEVEAELSKVDTEIAEMKAELVKMKERSLEDERDPS